MAVSPRLCGLPIVDTNGVPINGALVNVYAAGTTTPLNLYTNEGLSVAAANPIVATSGFVPFRYMATASYKLVVTTSAGAAVTGYDGDNIDPGVAVGSGALPIANGGTAGTTAAAARTNLAAASATDVATLQSDMSNTQTWIGYLLTTITRIASGTTAQEPAATNTGLRHDTTTGRMRWSNASAWRNVLTAGDWTAADMMTGGIVQIAQATPYTANAAITTAFPEDDTPPLISEGTEILTLTFTPKHASSLIILWAPLGIVSGSAASSGAIAALFKGNNCVAATDVTKVAASAMQSIGDLVYSESPGSVTPITYSVRFGPSAAGEARLNGTTSSRQFGGVAAARLFAIEVRG